VDGVSGVNNMAGLGAAHLVSPPPSPAQTSGALLPSAVGKPTGGQTESVGAYASSAAGSSTSIAARTESYVATYGASANSDALNLILLMAAMKLLTAEDDKDGTKALAGLLLLSMMMQQGSQSGTGMQMYNSSELSIQQSSFAASEAGVSMTHSVGQDAYGATANPQPQAGAGGIDVSA
jgi:hypothetical protein